MSCICIDGSNLLSGGGDGCLHLFDLEEENAWRCALRGHAAPISGAVLIPESASHRGRGLSSSVEGTVKLWDSAGGSLVDLLPPMAPDMPPGPLPLSLEGRGAPPRLFCGRGGRLLSLDLQAETVTGVLPLPSRSAVLDVSSASSVAGGSRSGGGAPGASVGSHLVATCTQGAGVVHLWDARLLPLATEDDARAFDELPASARRCLAATVQLPEGAACARQLHLDGSRLLCSVDYDATAGAFSRGAQSAALFDVRAASCAAAGSGGSTMLWEQPVRGDISCFHCREERVLVGTATGEVHLWSYQQGLSAAAGIASAEFDTGVEKREKREKWRAKVKVRGRFPKTQGFSNSKGFGGFSR